MDVKMAEKEMDRYCIFCFVFVKSLYLEIESMFTTGEKNWGKSLKETGVVTYLKASQELERTIFIIILLLYLYFFSQLYLSRKSQKNASMRKESETDISSILPAIKL